MPRNSVAYFLRRRALVELVVQQPEQRSGRNFTPCRPAAITLPTPTRRPRPPVRAAAAFLHAVRAHRRVYRRHQQRCGNSFSADVPDGQHQLVRAPGQKIVIVPADGARRTAESVHLQRFKLRNLPGKQLRLHFLRDGQFILQPLLFFLLLDSFLDGSSHRIERVGQRRQLVTRLHRNAMAEFAAVMCRVASSVEPRQPLPASHPRADNESDQFDDGKENSYADQDISHATDEFSQRRKQMPVEDGRPRGHLQ